MKQEFCGGGGSRTRVRINRSVSVYMFRLYSKSCPMFVNSPSSIGPACTSKGA